MIQKMIAVLTLCVVSIHNVSNTFIQGIELLFMLECIKGITYAHLPEALNTLIMRGAASNNCCCSTMNLHTPHSPHQGLSEYAQEDHEHKLHLKC